MKPAHRGALAIIFIVILALNLSCGDIFCKRSCESEFYDCQQCPDESIPGAPCLDLYDQCVQECDWGE